jgi:hypothetical protein
MSFNAGISYIVPGIGTVRDTDEWSGFDATDDGDDTPDPTTSQKPKPTLHDAVLCLAPSSLADAEKLLDAARGRGFAQIWVQTPETTEGRTLLTACIAAGKKRGLPVVALLSLMSATASMAAGTPLAPEAQDLNVFGDTGVGWSTRISALVDGLDSTDAWNFAHPEPRDLLAPEAIPTLELLRARLHAAADVPGLAGIAFSLAAGPGHAYVTSLPTDTLPGSFFGYTLANRLAFLRTQGFDPIDVDEWAGDSDHREIGWATITPYFESEGSEDFYEFGDVFDQTPVRTAWRNLRVAGSGKLLTALHADLAAQHPMLPVYIGAFEHDSPDTDSGYFERWERKTSLPRGDFSAEAVRKDPALLRRAYTVIQIGKDDLSAPADVPATEALKAASADLIRQIRDALDPRTGLPSKKVPAHIVLDFTTLTPAQAVLLLEAALPPVGEVAQ